MLWLSQLRETTITVDLLPLTISYLTLGMIIFSLMYSNRSQSRFEEQLTVKLEKVVQDIKDSHIAHIDELRELLGSDTEEER